MSTVDRVTWIMICLPFLYVVYVSVVLYEQWWSERRRNARKERRQYAIHCNEEENHARV